MCMLSVSGVTVHYGSFAAVSDLSFSLEEGQWLMLCGPNGAGKSTLIEAIARGVPWQGKITWLGQDLRSCSPRDLARDIGVLSQKNIVSYAYTVEEVVSLGRYAHQRGFLAARDPGGKNQVEQALEDTGLTPLRKASMLTLSGGETQRVFLAQVLAQNPRLLMLDEPANHLDLPYQQQLFSLLTRWLLQGDRAILSVVHDLTLARRFGSHALLMKEGRCAAAGPMEQVLTREALLDVYGMDVAAWLRESYAPWE